MSLSACLLYGDIMGISQRFFINSFQGRTSTCPSRPVATRSFARLTKYMNRHFNGEESFVDFSDTGMKRDGDSKL